MQQAGRKAGLLVQVQENSTMTKVKDRKKGILLLIASAFSFASMSAVSTMVDGAGAMQKMFVRSAIVALVTVITMLVQKTPLKVRRDCLKEHFFRDLFGMLGVVGNYYAVSHMLISDATMIMEMSPFFVILLSAIFLKEKTDARQYAFVALALAGEALVVKPSAEIFTNKTTLIVLGASICAGAAYMFVRSLGVKGENGSVTVLLFALFSMVCCIPSLIVSPMRLSGRSWLLLILMSLLACLGQFTVTAAYKYAPGSEISIFDYSQVIFTAIFGWVLYRQLADAMSFAGYVVIIGAALLMFLYNKKHNATE